MAIRPAAYLDFYNGAIKALDEFVTERTTDDTETTIAVIQLPSDARGFLIAGMIAIGVSDVTKGITGRRFIHWNTAGGVAVIGQLFEYPPDFVDGFTTATWNIDASGSTLRVRVTGEPATEIDWTTIFQNQYIEYTALT